MIKEFIQFEESIKRMAVVLPNISMSYLSQNAKYHETLAFIAYCGFKTDKETIAEIKELSATTPMDFNQAALYYVNSKANMIRREYDQIQ